MGRRLQLQALLKEVLGSESVYFQPPASVQMVYPCIVYQREQEDKKFADNTPYARMQRYAVTVIAKDPDSDIQEKLAMLPLCRYVRFFIADNLNHDVFSLYF